MFYLRKIYKIISSENWRIFISGWIKVVVFKRKFYAQRYKDLSFVFPDPLVFLWQFKEIFIDECYDMSCDNLPKVLIDCGANIGMCSLYWAKKFPDAKIFAIEADPEIVKIFQNNLKLNNVKNVEIINKAAWIYDGEIEFNLGPIDGGAIKNTFSKNTVTINCFNFASWLDCFEIINYLKIDIEGAESELISTFDISILQKVDRIFIEYHQFQNEISKIGKIISGLEDAGFSCFVTKVIFAPKNLNTKFFDNSGPFTAQCNIHGNKPLWYQK
jgi:FkbM family methyltransferase